MNKQKNMHFKRAFIEGRWIDNVRVSVCSNGLISNIQTTVAPDHHDQKLGTAIPGIPNIHSHAFQRVMAGLSEYKRAEKDTFWTWRELMYRFAKQIDPDSLTAIAAQLYIEMVKSGYTGVAEFHYLHHQPNGEEYPVLEALSNAIIDGAAMAGINLTLLPVLYMSSGFGGSPLSQEQLRFNNDVDSYLRLLESVQNRVSGNSSVSMGMAFHSLRAVAPDVMHSVLREFDQIAPDGPIHIHISEQIKEVDDCISWSGKRPVEWLLDNHAIDERWCLIHATHLDNDELARMAKSGAVAGLCPTTEANLGDGLFPLPEFIRAGGAIAIGSDSNSSVSPIEELRWLDYAQRLSYQSRNVSATKEDSHTGTSLINRCLSGGAKALGRKTGKLANGYQADILILNDQASNFACTPSEFVLDSFIFSGNQNVVKDVMVNGNWIVCDYTHRNENDVKERFIETVSSMRMN